MDKKQLIDFLEKAGIWVKDGKIAKADVSKVLASLAEAATESYKGWKITVQKKRGTDKYYYKISGINFSRTQNFGFTDTPEEAMKLAKKEVDSNMSKSSVQYKNVTELADELLKSLKLAHKIKSSDENSLKTAAIELIKESSVDFKSVLQKQFDGLYDKLETFAENSGMTTAGYTSIHTKPGDKVKCIDDKKYVRQYGSGPDWTVPPGVKEGETYTVVKIVEDYFGANKLMIDVNGKNVVVDTLYMKGQDYGQRFEMVGKEDKNLSGVI